jgi:hypothetical protein
MKTKLFLVVAMLVLMALGAFSAFAATSSNAELSPFEVMANGIIQPMAACNYYCSWCAAYGHGGACTASARCC